MNHDDAFVMAGVAIAPGTRQKIDVVVSQAYSGVETVVPAIVWRSEKPGPVVCINGAIHGDEINGTGMVREIILRQPFELSNGTLVLVPVINMPGFERHQRYLPDRRDLNRSFPGSPDGSLARRLAAVLFDEIFSRCDYAIDLHTAAVRRTNFPNVRADLSDERVARIAYAFGCELVVNSKGPKGTLRRAACRAGCATIILEAGEVWKIEPYVVEYGIRGIRNVLIELGMVEGKPRRPAYQTRVDKTKWIRAEVGGILHFHVAPGDPIEKGQPIATSATLLGEQQSVITSPTRGIIMGMTTLPAVFPGDPICHVAIPKTRMSIIRAAIDNASVKSLHERVRDGLATSVTVTEPQTHESETDERDRDTVDRT